MKIKRYSLFSIILLAGCHPAQKDEKNSGDSLLLKQKNFKEITSANKGLRLQIYGRWCTVGDTVSTFSIDKGGIYYYDALAEYKYVLSNDTLTIKFDDYQSKNIITITGNRLIMQGLEKFKGLNDTLYKCSH